MTPSTACAALIKSFEKCRLTAYLPTVHDVPTIGWGSTGPDIHLGMTWTQTQCDNRFNADLMRFGQAVAAAIGSSATTQGQFDALCSLAYNIGMQHFASSTVLRKHRVADYDGAATAFGLWNKQAGQVLNGLTRRRAAEARMYKGLPAEMAA